MFILSMESYIDKANNGIFPSIVEIEMLIETYDQRVHDRFPTKNITIIENYMKEHIIVAILYKLKHLVTNHMSPIIDFVRNDCITNLTMCEHYYDKLRKVATNNEKPDPYLFSYFMFYDGNPGFKYVDIFLGALPNYIYSLKNFKQNMENISLNKINFAINSLPISEGKLVVPHEILSAMTINMIIDQVIDTELLLKLDNMCIYFIKLYLFEIRTMIEMKNNRKPKQQKTSWILYTTVFMCFCLLIALIIEYYSLNL